MSREASTGSTKHYSKIEDLGEIFEKGARPYAQHKIGLETEKIGVLKDGMTAISFLGERGIESVLKKLAFQDGWESHKDGEHVIALSKEGMAITLEPGGQLELSGGVHEGLHGVRQELESHLDALCKVSRPLGVSWLGFGIQPFSRIDDIAWVPKSRYKIMRDYYSNREPLAHHMMKMSAATQVNLDYSDEQDAKEKVKIGVVGGCVISAMLANSCVEGGKLNGYCSKRLKIWKHTDADRCGTPEFFMDGSFSFEQYRDYALNVPMYFIYRDGKYIDYTHMTFKAYFEKNGGATHDDWENHLTTLFPDVRLKNHLEFRTMDATPRGLSIAAAAFWVGLFASREVTSQAYEMCKDFTQQECSQAQDEIALKGMDVIFKTLPMVHLSRMFLGLAQKGLQERALDEEKLLDPLFKIAEKGMSPAQEIIKGWPVSISELCS